MHGLLHDVQLLSLALDIADEVKHGADVLLLSALDRIQETYVLSIELVKLALDHARGVSQRPNRRTEGVASIPLPEIAPLELPDVPPMADLPAMPDLDDLLDEDESSAAPPPLDLPELPDF